MATKGALGRNRRVIALVLFLSFVVVPGVSAAQDGFVDIAVDLDLSDDTFPPPNSSVPVGDNIEFRLDITNEGTKTAEGARGGIDYPIGFAIVEFPPGCFADDIQIFAACDLPPLSPGETTEIIVTAKPTQIGTFEVVGGASLNPESPDFENDPPEDNFDDLIISVEESEEPQPMSDLAVTKQGPETAVVGENISYVIEVTNNGPNTARGISILDDLVSDSIILPGDDVEDMPQVKSASTTGSGRCSIISGNRPTLIFEEVSCFIDQLPPGESITINVVVVGNTEEELTNFVEIRNPELHGDTNDANNGANVATTLSEPADVSESPIDDISDELWTAVTRSDGEDGFSLADLGDAIQAYRANPSDADIGGVSVTLSDLGDLIQYYRNVVV